MDTIGQPGWLDDFSREDFDKRIADPRAVRRAIREAEAGNLSLFRVTMIARAHGRTKPVLPPERLPGEVSLFDDAGEG